MHFEFRRVFGRVPFIGISVNEIEIGYGAHAITFGIYPRRDGFYVTCI